MINKKIVAGVSALSVISIISGLLIYNNVTKQKGKEVLAASTQSENVKKDSNNTKKKNNNIKEEKAASVNEENTVSLNNDVSNSSNNIETNNDAYKGYDVVSKQINSDKKHIVYPYINGASDSLNNIFMAPLNDIMNNSLENSSFDFNFNVAFNKSNIVSINYKGILTNEQAAHPSKYDFGVNVDMNSAREIRLQDIFSLSDEFYDKVKSYGVVFVFSTCYAIGENTELKVPYSLISQYMNNGYASRVS